MPSQRQIKAVHTKRITSLTFILIPSSHQHLGTPNKPPPLFSGLPTKIFYAHSNAPTPYLAYFPLFDRHSHISWRVQIN